MASYLRGRGGRLEIDGAYLKVTSYSAKMDREEHSDNRYEDNGYSRRHLGLRTCEIQFEAVWDRTVNFLDEYFFLANIPEESGQDLGWEVEGVKLWPDLDQASNWWVEMPEAILTGVSVEASVDGRVGIKGTLKNQGYWFFNAEV